jgi:hypothetical protein
MKKMKNMSERREEMRKSKIINFNTKNSFKPVMVSSVLLCISVNAKRAEVAFLFFRYIFKGFTSTRKRKLAS